MSRQSKIEELITKYHRRLQKLEEKKATLGINTPPEVLIEIEDIEADIEHLREESKVLELQLPPDTSRSFPAKIGLRGNILAVLFGLCVICLMAYFGYSGIQSQVKTLIEATKTGEAISTAAALATEPTSTLVIPSPVSTPTDVVTNPQKSIPTSLPNPPLPSTNTPTSIVTPIPNPLPPSTITPTSRSFIIPEPLFLDDFDDKPKPEWATLDGTWVTKDGRYTMIEIGDEWTHGISLVGDPSWKNYQVKVKINLHKTFESNKVAVIINAQDRDDFLALTFVDDIYKSEKEVAAWWVVKDGEWTQVERTVVPHSYPLQGYFEVTVNNRENEIVTLINGEKISEWPDPPYTDGLAGVMLDTKNKKSPALFDDFSVWPIELEQQ